VKNKLLVILLFLLLSTAISVSGEDLPVITVLDFQISGISKIEATVFVDYLSSYVIDTQLFRVIDRTQRESILKEIEFSYNECSDENCQLEIGKLLSANNIIVGSLGQVASRFILNIKLIDVETGEAVSSSSQRFSSMNDLIDNCEFVVYKLLDISAPLAAEVAGQPVSSEKTVEPVPVPEDEVLEDIGSEIEAESIDVADVSAKTRVIGQYSEFTMSAIDYNVWGAMLQEGNKYKPKFPGDYSLFLDKLYRTRGLSEDLSLEIESFRSSYTLEVQEYVTKYKRNLFLYFPLSYTLAIVGALQMETASAGPVMAIGGLAGAVISLVNSLRNGLKMSKLNQQVILKVTKFNEEAAGR
jgi:TolB-like protein